MINKDKLTPYDVQILTLVALAPGAWSLSRSGMFHPEFGGFLRSLFGFGLQQNSSKELTVGYRQLSWRGQILLRREWERMLVQVVEGPPQRPDLSVTGMVAAQQGPPGAMGPMGPMGPPGPPGPVGQSIAAQQFQNALLGRAAVRPSVLANIISADDVADSMSLSLEDYQKRKARLLSQISGTNGVVANKDTGS